MHGFYLLCIFLPSDPYPPLLVDMMSQGSSAGTKEVLPRAARNSVHTHSKRCVRSPNTSRLKTHEEQDCKTQASTIQETSCPGTRTHLCETIQLADRREAVRSSTIQCDGKRSLAVEGMDRESRKVSEHSRKSNLLRLGPLSGLFCIFMTVASIVASLGILVGSCEAPVSKWTVEPSAYLGRTRRRCELTYADSTLAIFTAIANQSMRYAAFQGVMIVRWGTHLSNSLNITLIFLRVIIRHGGSDSRVDLRLPNSITTTDLD